MRCNLGIEHVARQPILRNAEAHHAAGERAGLDDRHGVAEPAQVVGRGQPRRSGADDEHALARSRASGGANFQPLLDRLVAEEALDRIDADRLVELAAIARGLARVIADASHDRGQRIVLGEHAPGRFVVARLGVVEPALDVLAGRAGVIAGRQPIDVQRPVGAPGAGLVGEARADVERDGERLVHDALLLPQSSRPYSAMLRSAIAWICAMRSRSGGLPNRWAKRFCSFRYSVTGTLCRIGVRAVTLPSSASNSGNSPDSTASRASLIVSAGADPQPSGQGTKMWM